MFGYGFVIFIITGLLCGLMFWPLRKAVSSQKLQPMDAKGYFLIGVMLNTLVTVAFSLWFQPFSTTVQEGQLDSAWLLILFAIVVSIVALIVGLLNLSANSNK